MNTFERDRKIWQTALAGLIICGLGVGMLGAYLIAGGKEPPETLGDGIVRLDIALLGLKASIPDDFAESEFLMGHVDHLASIALDDPEEALRQRLPMAICRALAYTPNCDRYVLLFAPDTAQTPSR